MDEIIEALENLIDEIDEWEVPQLDDDGLYGPTTAVGKAKIALRNLALANEIIDSGAIWL